MNSQSSPDNQTKEDTLFDRIFSYLNFYRVHLLFFTITPLIFSGIFYASNGRYKVSYVDSLFNCVSAMMVCGLATINLSELTGFQQALLFIQMCIGSPFEKMLEMAATKKAASIIKEDMDERKPWPHKFIAFFTGKGKLKVVDKDKDIEDAKKGRKSALGKLRPDMIRRMDDAPKLLNPSGWVSEGPAPSRETSYNSAIGPRIRREVSIPPNTQAESDESSDSSKQASHEPVVIDFVDVNRRKRRLSDPGHPSRPGSPTSGSTKMHRSETVATPTPKPTPPSSPKRFQRTQTVEFAPTPRRPSRLSDAVPTHGNSRTFTRATSLGGPSLNTHPTRHSHHSVLPENSMTRGFGGFPSPLEIISLVIDRLFPSVKRTLTRTVTIPATVSLTPSGIGAEPGKKQVPYISFEAVVGRNSAFHLLTRDQLEEIGGVEYRALNALLWIVPLYHFGIHLITFVIIAPYISIKRWAPVFQNEVRPLNSVWFSAFQVVSAYTNTGTSLVDESMVPFQEAYPMIFAMIFLILAGNTCFNPAIASIPVGVRVLDGFMQAIAVRAAGFAIVPLASLAPAVQVMYVFMMYISVYPIAMSVRSTNVYEEQSLGIFTQDDASEEEKAFQAAGPRMNVWSRYLAMHARQQLAFDMWWLALALFLICIIEKNNIVNETNLSWFTIFRIIFELVSAYGTVGLSLGIPDQNYSFAGAMHTLSKLIICLVMLRGRHRGLPVAIDRAVMLPNEFEKSNEDPSNDSISSANDDTQDWAFTQLPNVNGPNASDIRQRLSRRVSTRLSPTEEKEHQEEGEMNLSNDHSPRKEQP
ncbi:hypothetical protein CVT26_015675 [Gymnopilus dilepis]|uniref:Potassium transport protein n=1 Tax=Gymnopilus dilepis TaxID=231916 RepID=A0A409VFC7_9AGAR|nr:hypothetical protein CVT26_015675 [Gymnopilus dilepis]